MLAAAGATCAFGGCEALVFGGAAAAGALGDTTVSEAESDAQQIAYDEAASLFNDSGGLKESIIQSGKLITPGSKLGNPALIKALTADGSSIDQWAKYTTSWINSPFGQFQVRWYYNATWGEVNYDFDYKVKFREQ